MTGVLTGIGSLVTHPEAAPIPDAALAWTDGKIAWTGPAAELPEAWRHADHADAGGRCVIPGLIDCHTHLCFGGWRGDEFAQRLAGASYTEIQAAGGGIQSTVRATRASDQDALADKAGTALADMARLGVTTVEAKSGYGLSLDDEIKQLEVYRRLAGNQPVELVPTCLAAHLVPPEYTDDRDGYLDLLCNELIPRIADENLARFCDVFIEKAAYTLDEGRRVLESAQRHGLGAKIHADQLSAGGGARLAGQLGAVSAEHLEYADTEGISAMARAGTVAVSLPLASLYLRDRFLDFRIWDEAGVAVAIATDFNPGTAPSYHLHLALLLACLNQHMTPQQALAGATVHAAKAVGLEADHGRLEVGCLADLAVIDSPDINHWLYHFRPNACVGTLKGGEWIWRDFP